MIVKSAFRQVGDLAAHLLNSDTNREVAVVVSLVRQAPDDITVALRLFENISATNGRAVRHIVHFKISPALPLTEEQLARALDLIEAEHGIPSTTPRHVMRHAKGERADHFHVNYCLIDPDTGRAAKSNKNYLHDELASRRLELLFGEEIVPGPRQAEVVDELRRRGLTSEADALSAKPQQESGHRLDGNSRQQAGRLGVDVNHIMSVVRTNWIECGGDGATFVAALAGHGLRVAKGTKAVLVLDDATGFHAPLGRMLRQAGKEAGRPITIREPELRAAFPAVPVLAEARDAGFAAALKKAEQAVEHEFARFVNEAAIDDETDLAQRAKLAQARRKDEARTKNAPLRATLTARRQEIIHQYRRRNRIRRARVNRAFRAACWGADKDVREIVFGAAAGVVVLAGGGLGLALVAGGLAIAMLPTYERARALAAAAKLQGSVERDDLIRNLNVLAQAQPDDSVTKRGRRVRTKSRRPNTEVSR